VQMSAGPVQRAEEKICAERDKTTACDSLFRGQTVLGVSHEGTIAPCIVVCGSSHEVTRNLSEAFSRVSPQIEALGHVTVDRFGRTHGWWTTIAQPEGPMSPTREAM
jgi:hypothetical protein